MVSNVNRGQLFVPICFLFTIIILLFRLVFMANFPLLVEEAYYWNYAQHLDFSYLDHPPMVALLVKFGTLIWGETEWGVRFPTLLCWLLTALYSYRITALIKPEAGKYTVLFLSFLPYFFIHSLIITPDIPLILSWSATLFYLYKAMVLNKSLNWYFAGISFGLAMLSKYTAVLLGVSTLIYLLFVAEMRHWFVRKEPYLAALIAFAIFSPVIYWNATHNWASFIFQTGDRFHASDGSTFHWLIGLMVLFFLPMGIVETVRLFFISKKSAEKEVNSNIKAFFLVYTITPILFFAIFSLFHQIRFNWIGPSTLAVIPWFSITMAHNRKVLGLTTQFSWIATSFVILSAYGVIFSSYFLGWPSSASKEISKKTTNWQYISHKVYEISQDIASEYNQKPVVVALDKYNIASEINFYQRKLEQQKKIGKRYFVMGAKLFGSNSLMYNYWDDISRADGKYLLLVSDRHYSFDRVLIRKKTHKITQVKPLDGKNGVHQNSADQLYFQIVKMK